MKFLDSDHRQTGDDVVNVSQLLDNFLVISLDNS